MNARTDTANERIGQQAVDLALARKQRDELVDALRVAGVAFHSLGNPASRTAEAMKRGRQSAREHEGKVRTAIEKAEGS